MKVFLLGTVAVHPFYGTNDDTIDMPEELANILIRDGKAEKLDERLARIEAAKNGANITAAALVAPVVADKDPALDGLDDLFNQQLAGAPAVEEADKPSRSKK